MTQITGALVGIAAVLSTVFIPMAFLVVLPAQYIVSSQLPLSQLWPSLCLWPLCYRLHYVPLY